jgi:FkbM family methyltransferase
MNEYEPFDIWAHPVLPFKMRIETPMELYRAETMWTKEPETIEWVKSFDPHDAFFDVGANVGIYSLYAASLFPEMKIVAFEPHPENYIALLRNVALNCFNILPLQWAIGNRQGFFHLDIPHEESGKTGAQLTDRPGKCFCTRIDSIPNKGLLNIKIDIDGQEIEVIQGMVETLPRVKSILVEVSSKTKERISAALLTAGFTMDNRFNSMTPHSRDRRKKEGIDAENIIFTRS